VILLVKELPHEFLRVNGVLVQQHSALACTLFSIISCLIKIAVKGLHMYLTLCLQGHRILMFATVGVYCVLLEIPWFIQADNFLFS